MLYLWIKNIKINDYENEPYYIGNYGEEENYEEHEQYKACTNIDLKKSENMDIKQIIDILNIFIKKKKKKNKLKI